MNDVTGMFATGFSAMSIGFAACGLVWSTSGGPINLTRFYSELPAELLSTQVNQLMVDGGYVYWTDKRGAIGRSARLALSARP